MTKISLQIANFVDEKTGKEVPWMAAPGTSLPGLKKTKVQIEENGKMVDKWVGAFHPQALINLFGADNVSEMLKVCEDAIAQADAANAPKSSFAAPPTPFSVSVAPPTPPTPSDASFFCFDGKDVMVNGDGAIMLTAAEVLQVFSGNPTTLFCLVNTTEWKTPAQLGIFPVSPPTPVAPVAPPKAPQAQAPVAAAPSSDVKSSDVKSILERITASRRK